MFRALFAAAALMIAAVMPAHANLVSNGSFESGDFNSNPFDTLGSGSTTMTDWTVGGSGVDWIGSLWAAQGGTKSVDLNALNAGSVAQSVGGATLGQRYTVSFWAGINGDGNCKGANCTLNVQFGTKPAFSTGVLTNKITSQASWILFSFNVLLTGNSNLVISSLMSGAGGPAIDNVSIVSAVPVPASVWLLLSGLAGVAALGRRHRRSLAA